MHTRHSTHGTLLTLSYSSPPDTVYTHNLAHRPKRQHFDRSITRIQFGAMFRRRMEYTQHFDCALNRIPAFDMRIVSEWLQLSTVMERHCVKCELYYHFSSVIQWLNSRAHSGSRFRIYLLNIIIHRKSATRPTPNIEYIIGFTHSAASLSSAAIECRDISIK